MSIPVKIISGTESGTIKKGNFAFGVSKNRTYGPTSETGFYKGHTIPDGGYVFYLDRGTASPSAYVCVNDSDLISTVNAVSGENYQTVSDAVSWANTQSGAVAFDKPFNSIVTDGLVFNLDAGSLISYSGTGSTWYDLGSQNNGNLINGVGFDDDGYLVFDGVDDRVFLNALSTIGDFSSYTICLLIKVNRLSPSSAILGMPSSSTGRGTIIILGDVIENTTRVRIVVYSTRLEGTNTGSSLYPGPYGSSYVETSLQEDYWFKWRHITIRFDLIGITEAARRLRIYIDGVSGAATTRTEGANNTLDLVDRIGVRASSTSPLHADLSKLQIYDRPLSLTEIRQNYHQAPIVTDGLVFAVDAGNLVSYENGSTTVYNLSGTQSGTLINGVGYSKDKGGIWSFDGVDDRISFEANSTIQNLTTNFTIEAMVRFNTSGGQYAIFTKGNNLTQGWTLYLRQGPQFSFIGFNQSGVSSGLLAPTPAGGVSTNTWYHIVYTYDQVSVKSYINSEFSTSTNYTQEFISNGDTPTIGYDQSLGDPDFWNGNIGFIRLYNRALTQEEISQNFEAQRQRFGI
jgi:hypothetical protein